MILVPVIFRFPDVLARSAKRVAVLGSFNAWDPMVHLLSKTGDGDWTITIYLPPGRTLYHFSVDGTFWLDPHDEGRIPNGWGSEYSIRHVRAADPPGMFRPHHRLRCG
jgi:AMP-activated protein kinase-like protein